MVYEEEFDQAFLLEVDAAEAAALECSRRDGVTNTSGGRTGVKEAVPHKHQQRVTVSSSSKRSYEMEGGHHEEMPRYRWKVDSISVRDDAACVGSASERVGKGQIAVQCRRTPAGALSLVNVVVTADGGGGSAMDIPRHAMIGCSIIMSGLTLVQGVQHVPPPPIGGNHARDGSTSVRNDGDENFACEDTGHGSGAAVGFGPTLEPPLLRTPLGLPLATPERRRLAPTEFVTPPPSSIGLAPDGCGGSDGKRGQSLPAAGVADAVLAMLLYDFDHGIEGNGSGCHGSCLPFSMPSSTAACSSSGSSSDNSEKVTDGCKVEVGGGGTGVDEGRPVRPRETQRNKGDDAFRRLDSEMRRSTRTSGGDSTGQGGKNVSQKLGSGSIEGGGKNTGQVFCGRAGDVGCRPTKADTVTTRRNEEEDVPDGDWRRPPVVSTPNHRRSAAGRRRPRVRDGPRNGKGGRTVVLRLDDGDDDGDGGPAEPATRKAASSDVQRIERASFGASGVHGGGGGGGGRSESKRGKGEVQSGDEDEGGTRKRPFAARGSAGHRAESDPDSRRKATSPLPSSLGIQARSVQMGDGRRAKAESSWLALRRALHERYRDSEEHGAAEQTAAEAANRGRGGWGGEVMSLGLRVFWRQEQAFKYADALEERLTPEDAARYKVLSFETSSGGKRKFLVCDVRRFEEKYPLTASPDRALLRHLLPPPTPRQRSYPGTNGAPPVHFDAEHEQQQKQQQPLLLQQQPQPQPQPHEQREHDSALRAREGEAAKGRWPNSETFSSSASSSPSSQSYPLRHVYEIIREACPCRMYFDLEFTRGYNPGLEGEELVRSWINVVAGKLHQDFGISVGGADFLDLDSSTPKKFSRHLILHLPGDQLFQDNSHVGRFVNSLAADLETWRPLPPGVDMPGSSSSSIDLSGGQLTPGDGSGGTVPAGEPTHMTTPLSATHTNGGLRGAALSDITNDNYTDSSGSGDDQFGGALERLWVKDSDGRSKLFADVSVYTRNRCFRLVGSSKFGKLAALGVAATNQRTLESMVWRGNGGPPPRTWWWSSPPPTREQQQQITGEVARTLLHDSLVVPATLRPKGERFLSVGGGSGDHRYSRFGRNPIDLASSQPQPCKQQQQQGGWPEDGEIPSDKRGRSRFWDSGEHRGLVSSQGFGQSPFPAVDSFLRTLICQGGTKGDLRQWTYAASENPPRGGRGIGGGGRSSSRRSSSRDGDVDAGASSNGNGKGNGSTSSASGNGRGCGAVRPPPGNENAPPAVVMRKLTHQVANNRWCCNIGRAHKSNHVYLVTDLSKGEVRQHCHDQECRRSGYRSNPVRLPPEVAPSKDDLEAYELELGLAAAMTDSPADWAAVA